MSHCNYLAKIPKEKFEKIRILTWDELMAIYGLDGYLSPRHIESVGKNTIFEFGKYCDNDMFSGLESVFVFLGFDFKIMTCNKLLYIVKKYRNDIHATTYNLDYEHAIVELLRIVKIFDWEKDVMIWFGW